MNVIGDSSGQCEKEFEEKIRGALEKIREANYRKVIMRKCACTAAAAAGRGPLSFNASLRWP